MHEIVDEFFVRSYLEFYVEDFIIPSKNAMFTITFSFIFIYS